MKIVTNLCSILTSFSNVFCTESVATGTDGFCGRILNCACKVSIQLTFFTRSQTFTPPHRIPKQIVESPIKRVSSDAPSITSLLTLFLVFHEIIYLLSFHKARLLINRKCFSIFNFYIKHDIFRSIFTCKIL